MNPCDHFNEKIKVSSQRILSKSGLLRTLTTLPSSMGFYRGIGGWSRNFWNTKLGVLSQDGNKEFGNPRPRSPQVQKLMYGCTFFSYTVSYTAQKLYNIKIEDKQEMISKVHVCQKANKSQNLKNIYVTNTRNSQSIGGTLFQRLFKRKCQ